MVITATLSERQATAFKLLDDPQVVELYYGGGAGGGKTITITEWAVLQCRKYPGIRIGLGRKEITNLRKTTVQTLLNETHKILQVMPDEYRYSSHIDPGIYYINGSEIVLIDLAHNPGDPDFDRLGSLNLTHSIIEEAGEVAKKAKDVLSSRKNRYLNDRYGITGKTIITSNPSQNFVREEYYDKYIALGAGHYQKWQTGYVYVNGEKLPAYTAFVRSLVTDNPFISKNYIEVLDSLPSAERKRLKEGDWEYFVDDNTLFKTWLMQEAQTDNSAEGWTGCDPARRGGDKTIMSLIRGDVVADIETVTIPEDIKDIGTYVAERFITFSKRHNVGYRNAAVDAVGIGASVVDACERLGFSVQQFNAGSTEGVRDEQGVMLFNNIRSQNYWDMAEQSHTGELKYAPGLPYFDDLKKDYSAHNYSTEERKIIVESKKKMKERLGRSPDYSDAVQAAFWAKNTNQNAFLNWARAKTAQLNDSLTS